MTAANSVIEKGDLTRGPITSTLLKFTMPMMACSLLQQCYNIADTLIVGQFLGTGALAAVGSAYAFMVFLISILIGLRWEAVLFSPCFTVQQTSRNSEDISLPPLF